MKSLRAIAVTGLFVILVLYVFLASLYQASRPASTTQDLAPGGRVLYASLDSARSPSCSRKCLAGGEVYDESPVRKSRGPSSCPKHSHSYFGTCPCYPGYTGDECDVVLEVANPWYSAYCPNLDAARRGGATFSPRTPLDELGGEFYSFAPGAGTVGQTAASCAPMPKDQRACAYLCFSHPSYGAAVVPESLWKTAQQKEAELWKSLGGGGNPKHDRAVEHWRGFDNFNCIPGTSLGRVIEVGAGPWTQLKGLLHARTDLSVTEFTVFEPGADGYVKNVASCSYRSGRLETWSGEGHHAFPVVVRSQGGELLDAKNGHQAQAQAQVQAQGGYDTLLSINVVEHVESAFAYLSGLHRALRPGGLLIFHERFYNDTDIVRGDEWHPVRVKQQVIDTFLTGFTILYNNCGHDYDGRPDERGYYVIARKR